ncbi:MAG TPA: hypothetical protein VMH39_12015 [Gemmatimonadaceae bacterium]|nr:hypothetical protein [Gemmatimonadaceae bacterium]
MSLLALLNWMLCIGLTVSGSGEYSGQAVYCAGCAASMVIVRVLLDGGVEVPQALKAVNVSAILVWRHQMDRGIDPR